MTTSTATAPRTLCEAFQATTATHPDAVALRTPGGTVVITWRQYAHRVRRIAAGLANLGVRHGDTVGIMLTNRPEFHLVDTGALHAGATPFSVYNTLAPEQLNYVVTNAGNRIMFCEKQFPPVLRRAVEGTAVKPTSSPCSRWTPTPRPPSRPAPASTTAHPAMSRRIP